MEYEGQRFSASPSPSPPHLRSKRHRRLTACFRPPLPAGDFEGVEPLDPSADAGDERPAGSVLWSSTAWIRSKAHELPDLGEKCRGLLCSCGGGHHHGRHRRRASADCRYDALSYALNFDEGVSSDGVYPATSAEDLRYRCFSYRIPASPPPAVGAAGFEKARIVPAIKVMESPL